MSSQLYALPGSATTRLTAGHRVYVWKHLFSCTSHHLLVPSSTIQQSWRLQSAEAELQCTGQPVCTHTTPVRTVKHCHSNWMGKHVPLCRCRLLGSIYLTLESSPTVSSLEAERTQECVCTVQTLSKLPIAVILHFNIEQQEGT